MALWLLQLRASRSLLPPTLTLKEVWTRSITKKILCTSSSCEPIITRPRPTIFRESFPNPIQLPRQRSLQCVLEATVRLKHAAWDHLHLPVTFPAYLPFQSEPGQATAAHTCLTGNTSNPVDNNKELPPPQCEHDHHDNRAAAAECVIKAHERQLVRTRKECQQVVGHRH